MSGAGIDAVVVSHNSAEDLRVLLGDERFLDSFDRVIVVDSASSDDSTAIVSSSSAELIALERNRGFATGANAGVRASSAEYVAVLNPDIRVPDPGAVDRLLHNFDDPRVAVSAPALRLPDGQIQDSARTVPNPATLVVRRGEDPRRGALRLNRPTAVPWVVAAFIVLRRRQMLEVGGFDEQFFLYFEDVDLCVRLRRQGYRVLFDPTVVLHHEHRGESQGSLTSPAVRRHAVSALRFYRRYPGHVIPARLRARASETMVVSWSAHTRRAHELATALDGRSFAVGGMGLRGRWSAPVRWSMAAARTAVCLARSRPRSVIVQNPPIFLGLLALAYCSLTDAGLVLDSHPASFGRKGALRWRLLVPLHRWVARRARAVLVTENQLTDVVEGWGARGLVVHEAPRAINAFDDRGAASAIPDASPGRIAVLLVNVFASDEPIEAAVAAAALAPEVDLYVTGDLRLAPSGLVDAAPANVTFVGFLPASRYAATMRAADVVMTLTTESTSVMRSGYEAVYSLKPLIVSDWPIGREIFQDAVFTANDPAAIGSCLREAGAQLHPLRERAARARERQLRRWHAQLDALRSHLAHESPAVTR